MNSINHFDQNRPVHLARRDVYFEKASELIAEQGHSHIVELNTDFYEEVLFMFRTARQHARFAVRTPGKNEHDEQFCLFINLMAGNVKAVLSMIKLQGMVEREGQSSFGFLGVNQATAGIQAEEYQRRASDIVRSMQSTLKLAQEPFERLKKENRASAAVDDNIRYRKARKHFAMLISKKPLVRHIPSLMRKFLRV